MVIFQFAQMDYRSYWYTELCLSISHGGNLYYRKLKNNYDKMNGKSRNIVRFSANDE